MDSVPRHLRRMSNIQLEQAKLHRARQRWVAKVLRSEPGSPEEIKARAELGRIDLLESAHTDAFLAKCVPSYLALRDAEREEMSLVSDEQLAAQLSAELVAAVRTWDSDQWAVVLRAGVQAWGPEHWEIVEQAQNRRSAE